MSECRYNGHCDYKGVSELEQQNEALLAQAEELRAEIHKQDEYYKSFYGHASGMMASLLEVANKTPQQSLSSIQAAVEIETIARCVCVAVEVEGDVEDDVACVQSAIASIPHKYQPTE